MSTRLQQCQGTTLKGKRCQRMLRDEQYCSSHRNCPTRLGPIKETSFRTSPLIRAVTSRETCCVCLDQEADLLNCQHPLCTSCLNKLSRDNCPVCRKALEGRQVTKEALAQVRQRGYLNKQNEETANYLVALALEENPNLDPVLLYDRFYTAL